MVEDGRGADSRPYHKVGGPLQVPVPPFWGSLAPLLGNGHIKEGSLGEREVAGRVPNSKVYPC